MNAIEFSNALGKVNDKYIMEAVAYERKKKAGWLKWGAMAACLGLIFTITMLKLPGILRGQGNIVPPPNSDVPGPVVSDDDQEPEHLQPPGEMEIIINWDDVIVNESMGVAPDATRLYPDPALYVMETWGQKEIKDYYGWELNVPYIPDGLTDRGNAVTAVVYRDKATGKMIEDQVGRSFWSDYYEDGSPKSDDDIVIPKGFTITVSKLGILHCGLLPVDEERTTDFGGIPVTLSHCSLPYGSLDPTQKASDGLSNIPAGYYDIYTASFTLDGVEYEINAQRMELEEVIKITASVINRPYRENFTVGGMQDLPDKASEPTTP